MAGRVVSVRLSDAEYEAITRRGESISDTIRSALRRPSAAPAAAAVTTSVGRANVIWTHVPPFAYPTA